MSMGVFQPVGQKRLTNIAVVRYKKYGKRFEIACYKNKVKDWRNEIEKDLDEVLQTVEVFSNVSKALLANDEDLKLVFGTTDRLKVCQEILNNGEMQVSDKERKQEMDVIFKDVAKVLSNMCIDTNTNRPYTHNTLERALHDIHFKVDPKRPAKLQALEALKLLQEQFSIARASLGLLIFFDERGEKDTRNTLKQYEAETLSEYPQGNKIVIQCTIQPGNYRALYNSLQQIGDVKVEIDPTATKNDAAGNDSSNSNLNLRSSSQQYNFQSQQNQNLTSSSKAQIQIENKDGSSNLQNVRQYAREEIGSSSSGKVIYPRGPIDQISEELSNRKQMFLELDSIEEGWQVELIQSGEKVDAVFYSPNGEKAGAFVRARKQALTNRKNRQNS
eukprot:TRINITY_DN28760_c0_g4_i1.p1 TRINITY_DN28760_c0_g4~~TRINITY_DN28760_c0_g4_i1.p1  ORF type:complete len:413 (-),score=63.97 TRINITY_DN28760_c0_g4_i1:301-1464(-)